MTDDALADLARLRSIAEQGRRLPLLGGRQLILWGTAVASATLVHGAMAAGWLGLPPAAIAILWFGVIGATLLVARLPAFGGRQAAAVDLANRIEWAVWQAGGLFLIVAAAAIFAYGNLELARSGSAAGFRLFALMPPVTFGVYAIAMRVSAEVAAIPALKGYAALAIACAAATILLIGSAAQLIVAALGLAAVSVLPGLLLLRLEGPRPQ